VAHILIVEDSPDNMRLFQAVLRHRGHRVTGLADGTGVLEVLEADPPELVLMDIQLPGSDGYALLRAIRAAGYQKLPVVALTAHAMAGDRAQALEAGFDEHITKPIEVRSFPGLLEELMGPDSAPGE